LLDAGLDYTAVAERLGVPAGQVYLIATGRPADGSKSRGGAQALANPRYENPTAKESVAKWLKTRSSRDEQMLDAARRRTAEPPPIEDADAAHDAVTVLGRDHNQVKYLLKQLEALPSHTTGGSAEQLDQRKSIVDMITVRLSEHEAVEEEYLWPTVRSELADGDRWADGALEQEQQGKDTLAALGELAPDTDEFDELVSQLVTQLGKHVGYEDHVFLRMRAELSEGTLNDLGERILAGKKRPPTRPHPHAPKRPAAAVKAAGATAAAMDHTHDAAGDRPAERKGGSRTKPKTEGDA
jgi:hypothetical protein